MGQTKPVWLVALQSAAEGMMGNRLLTREEFEASIAEICARHNVPVPPLKKKPLPKKRKAKVKS